MSKDAPDSPYASDHKSKRKDKWHRKKAKKKK